MSIIKKIRTPSQPCAHTDQDDQTCEGRHCSCMARWAVYAAGSSRLPFRTPLLPFVSSPHSSKGLVRACSLPDQGSQRTIFHLSPPHSFVRRHYLRHRYTGDG